MIKRCIVCSLLGMLLAVTLVGCAAGGAQDQPADEQPALTITGLVDKPQSWTLSQIKDMEKAYTRALCADSGQERDFAGPLVNALLDEASPKSDATKVVFKGEYDITGEIALSELRATTDGIVAISGSGKLRVILPGQPGTAQVNGLYGIEVQ